MIAACLEIIDMLGIEENMEDKNVIFLFFFTAFYNIISFYNDKDNFNLLELSSQGNLECGRTIHSLAM